MTAGAARVLWYRQVNNETTRRVRRRARKDADTGYAFFVTLPFVTLTLTLTLTSLVGFGSESKPRPQHASATTRCRCGRGRGCGVGILPQSIGGAQPFRHASCTKQRTGLQRRGADPRCPRRGGNTSRAVPPPGHLLQRAVHRCAVHAVPSRFPRHLDAQQPHRHCAPMAVDAAPRPREDDGQGVCVLPYIPARARPLRPAPRRSAPHCQTHWVPITFNQTLRQTAGAPRAAPRRPRALAKRAARGPT